MQTNLDKTNERQAVYYNSRRKLISFKIRDRILKMVTKQSEKPDKKRGRLYDQHESPFIIKKKGFSNYTRIKKP